MFEALGEHPQSQRLHARNRFVLCLSVGQDAGQGWDFRNPAAVILAFDLDVEVIDMFDSDK